ALGTVLNHSDKPSFCAIAGWLFEQTLPIILSTTSPRAWAFALVGIHEYSQKFAGDRRSNHVRDELAGRLLSLYKNNRTENWRWYEEELSYCNAILPHALITCGKSIPNNDMIDIGLESLDWLVDLQRSDAGHFVPIGSNGFYRLGGERARFDQQPVEAQTMVSACLEAFRITKEKRWNINARRAFEWFLGRNDLNLSVYDPTTGGCRDGLHSDRLNENQGAESTLAYLQSVLELRLAKHVNLSLEIKIK
ncbi:MAG: glycosyl transferase family 1, partial [Melioribacteraceae bacterium]